MNYKALFLLCSTICIVQATIREELLGGAVRESDVPLLTYHLAGLDRDGVTKGSKKQLVERLIPFAEKVLDDEQSHATLRSKDDQFIKIVAGVLCAVAGYYVAMKCTGKEDLGFFGMTAI